MNLMNVLTCKWEERLLQACGGPELRAKLGPEPVMGGTVLGNINTWWVKRWGFDPGISCVNCVMEFHIERWSRLYHSAIYGG
jgi:sugar (pentulose or hexulose) kinase